MLRYLIRRLAMMPVLLLGVATIAFILTNFTKGDPLLSLVNERQLGNPEVVAAVKARWGLDKSLPERYGIYISNLAQGDFGVSFRTKRSVGLDIAERLPATLELVIAAMIVGTGFGLLFGVLAAHYRNRPQDHAARLFALIGSSTPVFWSGLILLYLFSVKFGVLPGAGRLGAREAAPPFVTGMFTIDALLAGNWAQFREALSHLILPALVLGWAVTGIISRLVRASMLDVLAQDYILTARSKGASETRVLVNHALRNAMIPALTIIGFSFAYLITGAVLTETVFSWPGIGSYAVESARALDHPAIVGVTLIGAIAFLLSNLLTDIAYAFANPRIRIA
ncbi:ABC transporter permease [Pikeienuella sp. HZG-20]|uniref:ABC transporter permease n=1 Tax=Paludibacillus litoralis TaxID=3133267 RepID=UPI0030ED690B